MDSSSPKNIAQASGLEQKGMVIKMKKDRHTRILELIEQNAVETQDQLIALLRADGMTVTQATVSRDIKDLKLIKTAEKGGKYKYAKPKALDFSKYDQEDFTL